MFCVDPTCTDVRSRERSRPCAAERALLVFLLEER